MAARISDEIIEALKEHDDRPLRLEDAAGQVYYVLTGEQFQQYVYDDSDLSGDEMIAAAAHGLDDPAGWEAPGMDRHDQGDSTRDR